MGTGASSDPSLTSGQAESSCGWRSWDQQAGSGLGLCRAGAAPVCGPDHTWSPPAPLAPALLPSGPRCQCQEEGEHTHRGDGVSLDETLRASALATWDLSRPFRRWRWPSSRGEATCTPRSDSSPSTSGHCCC